MSGHGSISSPMQHDHASYYSDAAHSMHEQVGGQFISDGLVTADPTAAGSSDPQNKDDLELTGSGLRVNAKSLRGLAEYAGIPGLPGALSAAFVEGGKGRLSVGLTSQLPKKWLNATKLVRLDENVNFDFRYALMTYGRQGATGSPMAAPQRQQDTWPTVEDGVINVGFPFPSSFIPVEARFGFGRDAVRRTFDVSAEGEVFQGYSRPTDTTLYNPLEDFTSPPHVWGHAAEETDNIGAVLQHYKKVPFLGAFGRYIPGYNSLLSNAFKEWLSKLFIPSLGGNYKMTSKLLVQECIGADEHKRRIQHQKGCISKDTWRAWLTKLIDNNILCTERYNADGKIHFWPKRFFYRWAKGAISEKIFSPHNIPHMQPGETRVYERARAITGKLNASFSWLDLVTTSSLRLLAEDIKGWFMALPKLRNPFNISAAFEHSQTQEKFRLGQYVCRSEGGGVAVHTKTIIKNSRLRDETANGRAFSSGLTHTFLRSRAARQSLTLDSVYPLTVTSASGGTEPNAALDAARYNPHNPAGLPEAWLNEEISEAHVAQCLRSLRTRALDQQRAKDTTFLQQQDQRLVGERVLDEYDWRRKTAFVLSSRPGAAIGDRRTTYASGIKYIAEPLGLAEVRTRRELFVRSTEIQSAPAECKEFISVTGCFGRVGPHSERLEHMLMRIELKFDPSFKAKDINDALAKFGHVFEHDQPLPTVSQDGLNSSRNIQFEARINQSDLVLMRQRLLQADLTSIGAPFSIDEASLRAMLDGGLNQADSLDLWVKAVGDFVCKHQQPALALQFLAHLVPNRRFTVAEGSSTDTALRLNSDAKRLLNSFYDEPVPTGPEAYAPLYRDMAAACRLYAQAKVAYMQQQEDPLVSHKTKEDDAATFRLVMSRLRSFRHKLYDKYGINLQQFQEYMIAKGITTEDDMLVSLYVKLPKVLVQELSEMQQADTLHLNEVQAARFAKRLAQLRAAHQVLNAANLEQARRLHQGATV